MESRPYEFLLKFLFHSQWKLYYSVRVMWYQPSRETKTYSVSHRKLRKQACEIIIGHRLTCTKHINYLWVPRILIYKMVTLFLPKFITKIKWTNTGKLFTQHILEYWIKASCSTAVIYFIYSFTLYIYIYFFFLILSQALFQLAAKTRSCREKTQQYKVPVGDLGQWY